MLSDSFALAEASGETREQRADDVFDFVAAWLFSNPMRDLLTLFQESVPEQGSGSTGAESSTDWLRQNEELPQWLDDVVGPAGRPSGSLTSSHIDVLRRTLDIERRVADDFDFRGRGTGQYRERNQASSADFSEDVRDAVVAYTRQLGLVDPQSPRHRRYDMTLVLGGGYKSPQLRAKLAAKLAADGIELGELYFLGSPRFLIAEPPEAPKVAYYAPDARDEFDLMVAGARSEFGLVAQPTTFLCGCGSQHEVCPRWLRAHAEDDVTDTPPEYTHQRRAGLNNSEGRHRGVAISASTHRPPYRPDTSDTFALWTQIANPQPGQRGLIVTTQVFVPFQTFDGVRRLYLDNGVLVDAVGFGAEWGDRPKTAEYLLQETLSAIRSARRLLVDAADALRAPETI